SLSTLTDAVMGGAPGGSAGPQGATLARRHAGGGEAALLRGDAEWGVDRAIAAIGIALHDFEEEAFADIGGVKLEKRAVGIAVIEDIGGAQLLQQGGIKAQPGLQVIIVIRRNLQRAHAVLP